MDKNYLRYLPAIALLINAACVSPPQTSVSSTPTSPTAPSHTPEPIPSVTSTVIPTLAPSPSPTLAEQVTPTPAPVSIDPAELLYISSANAQDLKPLAVLLDTEINTSTLQSGIYSSAVSLLNLDAKPILSKARQDEAPMGFTFSKNRKLLALIYFLSVDVWDVETNKLLQTFDFPITGVSTAAFNSNGNLLAIGETEEGGVAILQTASGAFVKSYDGPLRQIMSLAFSQDGHLFAAGGDFGEVYVWDTPTAQRLHKISTLVEDDVSAILITSDNSRMVTSSGGWRTVVSFMEVWDLKTGLLIQEFEGDNFRPTLNPSENLLVSFDETGVIKLWNFSTYSLITTLPGAGASAITFTPDGKLMLSVAGNEVTFWGVK